MVCQLEVRSYRRVPAAKQNFHIFVVKKGKFSNCAPQKIQFKNSQEKYLF